MSIKGRDKEFRTPKTTNVLAAAPYQEVLLTETGHRFYEITRMDSGALALTVSEKGATYHVDQGAG